MPVLLGFTLFQYSIRRDREFYKNFSVRRHSELARIPNYQYWMSQRKYGFIKEDEIIKTIRETRDVGWLSVEWIKGVKNKILNMIQSSKVEFQRESNALLRQTTDQGSGGSRSDMFISAPCLRRGFTISVRSRCAAAAKAVP
jgi:hypothetical protein